MAAFMQQKAFANGTKFAQSTRSSRCVAVVCRAQNVETTSRRAALGALAGVALLSAASPSRAAFGDSANVFGKVTNKSGVASYVSDDFTMLLPARWNPSKEQEYSSAASNRIVELRYEDNFDYVNNLVVLSQPTDKKSIEDFGDQQAFLKSVNYLLGVQSFDGQTESEGGFAPGRVAAASLLDQRVDTDKKGRNYYKYEVLTRTADGDEGGKHHLIGATVGAGKLYIIQVQIGDKRWFKGIDKEALKTFNSFTVAA